MTGRTVFLALGAVALLIAVSGSASAAPESPLGSSRYIYVEDTIVGSSFCGTVRNVNLVAADYPASANPNTVIALPNLCSPVFDIEISTGRSYVALNVGQSRIYNLAAGTYAVPNLSPCKRVRWRPDDKAACSQGLSLRIFDPASTPIGGVYTTERVVFLPSGLAGGVNTLLDFDWVDDTSVVLAIRGDSVQCPVFGGAVGLWRYNIDTEEASVVVAQSCTNNLGDVRSIDVSPSSMRIVWHDGVGVHMVDIDGANQHTVPVAFGADVPADRVLWELDEAGLTITTASAAGLQIERLSLPSGARAVVKPPPAAGTETYKFTSAELGDTVAPIVTGVPDRPPDQGEWYSAPVTVTWSATDPQPSSGPPSTPPATIVSSEGADQVITSAPSCDPTGNCATGAIELSIDMTAPDIVCSETPTYVLDETGALLSAAVVDGVSGPVTPVVSVPVDTSAVTEDATVEVTGIDNAGNEATEDCHYRVISNVIEAAADTYVRSGAQNTNEGAATFMQVSASGDNRSLVRFEQTAIEALVGSRQLVLATLELTITQNQNNWGPSGRPIGIHRLTSDWLEGNGFTPATRGTGPGATWECAIDAQISNQATDCSLSWEMGQPNNPAVHPWIEPAAATALITNGQSGAVTFDLTNDVATFLAGSAPNSGWIVKKVQESQPGQARFGTREAGISARLVLHLAN